MTLTFLWFEWPPAHALEELGKEYTKTRPNVTVKVNTVPNAQWHDAIFTQFAARKTNFDMPILDSQNIGEAVTNGSILDITDFVKKNIDTSQYDPYFLAAYGQYPQNADGRGQPGRQDLRPAAARRHVGDDLAQGPDGRQASGDVGRHDRRGQEVPAEATRA